MRRFIVLAAISIVMFLGTAGVAVARPIAIACGSAVSGTVTLTSDLNCPSGNALNADVGTTINLNGHLIRGGGNNIGIAGDIFVNVSNGRITDFASCIQILQGGGSSLLTNLAFTNCNVHIDKGGTKLTSSNFDNASFRTLQGDVNIENNVFYNGPGLTAIDLAVSNAMLRKNSVSGYRTAVSLIGVGSSANFNGNTINNSGTGIVVQDIGTRRSLLAYNTIYNNSRDGIDVSGDANLIIRGNVTNGNGGDGIIVSTNPPPSRSLNVTLTANSANANTGTGIVTPRTMSLVKIIDGGGNTAQGNGAGQCSNIACSP